MHSEDNLSLTDETAPPDDRSKLVVPIAVVLIISVMLWYALVSNSRDANSGRAASQYLAAWQQLPDGSNFAVIRPDPSVAGNSRRDMQSSIRCWPADSAVSCIQVTEDTGVVLGTNVSIVRRAELPESVLPSFDADGYACGTMMGTVTESISTGSSKLTSNQIDSLDKRWSKAYVNRIINENRIDGAWFDCLAVLREVSKGSVDTLGSTLVTKAALP